MARKPKKTTWVSLIGKAEPTKTGLRHIPLETKDAQEIQAPTLSLSKTDTYFSAGTVEITASLNSTNDRLQLILNQGLETQIFCGLNTMSAAYGILSFRSGQWEPLNTAGTADNLPVKREIRLRVEVNGSNIVLFVDDVEVCRASAIIQRSQLSLLIDSKKPLEITSFEATPHSAKAFIVMQFTEEFNSLYDEVIRPVCEQYGFECIRADDIYNNGLIIEDITRSIRQASIIIADVTPNNPNVFYEVGYAHGLNKTTILLSDRKRERLPFDISGFRTLFYDNTIGGKSAIEQRLKEHLRNIKI